MTAAVLPEVTNYDATVYQIQITDAVQGYNSANPNNAANQGISNQAALNLANRTNYLKAHMDALEAGTTIPPTVAPLLSPNFTGTPTMQASPALGDNSLKLSTTAFVQNTIAGVAPINMAGSSNVSLTAVQAGNGILNCTGALTANVAAILPNVSGKWIVENNTTGAFTLTVKTAAGTGVAVSQGKSVEIFGDGTNIYLATNDFSNIQLTGTPTAPTPSVGDQSTKVATTNFAYQLKNGVVSVPVGGGSNVTLTPAQYGNGIMLLTGALTAAIEVLVPAQGGTYVVANQTTGAFGLTMGCSGGGATATIPQGQSVIVYCDGTNTVLAGAAASSSFSVHTFTATAGQTVFPCSYTPGNILVIQDGSTLGSSNFTATDGANVILNTGAPLNDEIQVIAFSSFTVANAVTRNGATMIGAMQLFGGDTGVAPATGDNSSKLVTSSWVNPLGAHGQCRLSVASTTSLKLAPYGGQCLNINGTVQQIPQAGITISNGSLAASTVYYVYAYMNAGSMTLELSATTHATGSNGVEQKSGDATRTLVGMIATNSASQFVDSVAQRFCLNWFGRRALQGKFVGSGTYTNTGSNVEISAAARVSFLTWADEAVYAFSAGNLTTNTANASTSFSLFMDSAPFGPQQSINPASANIGGPYNSGSIDLLSEGVIHTSSPYGFVSSGTGTATYNHNVSIRG